MKKVIHRNKLWNVVKEHSTFIVIENGNHNMKITAEIPRANLKEITINEVIDSE
jgi:hypothetical protein